MALIDRIVSKLSKPLVNGNVLKPGVYHYASGSDHKNKRIHLRIEPDGFGILIINANQLLHLNQTATCLAYYHLEKIDPKEILKVMSRDFRTNKKQLVKDYEDFVTQISQLIDPNSSACPICDLGIETTMPFSHVPSAPYRMDLAITYRCNNDCPHCYNARNRNHPELPYKDWEVILKHLWSLGIPHIVFTGGEPTLHADLSKLIHYSEEIGQITGLNTNGRRLKEKAFTRNLISAGLDHVQITLESQNKDIHDRMVNHPGAWAETVAGIKNAVDGNLYVMTNTTLLKDNSDTLPGLLDFLASEGVKTVGLNALIYSGRGRTVGTGLSAEELPDLLSIAREITSKNDQRLIWYTPTQYCHFDPVQMELGVKGCTAALYNMCIEPDGNVIPCQSFYSPLGNILKDSWESIWNHQLARELRERKKISAKCLNCAFITECGGGCPLASHVSEPNPEIITDSEFS